MQTTYRIKEQVVSYRCAHCGHEIFKSSVGRSRFFPNELKTDCHNKKCPSYALVELAVEEIEEVEETEGKEEGGN